jgi:hypothetical protein
VLQLFRWARSAASAAKMFSRYPMSLVVRVIVSLISSIEHSRVVLLVRYRAARSCLDFWSAVICASSIFVFECGVYCEEVRIWAIEGWMRS